MVPFEIFRELHTEIRMGFAHLKSNTIQQVVLVYDRDRLLVGDTQHFDGLKSIYSAKFAMKRPLSDME